MTLLAAAVRANRAELNAALVRVETYATARTELDWLLAGLTPSPTTTWLSERRGIGTVIAATTAAMPLYSTLLFALAPALAEAGLPLELTDQPWREFAEAAADNADGMVYCGSADHAAELDRALPERVYVHHAVYDKFVDALLARAAQVRTAPNSDPSTQLGPLLIGGLTDRWLSDLSKHGIVVREPEQHGPVCGLAIVEAGADAPIVLEEKYCPVLPLVTYRNDRQLAERCNCQESAEILSGITRN